MLRDLRSAPFCWQEKLVMRRLRAHYDGPRFSHRSTAIAIYQALTEIASNQNSQNEARAFVRQLGAMAGCSDRTAQRYIREFETIGLVITRHNRIDERTNTANTYCLVSPNDEADKSSPYSSVQGEGVSPTSPPSVGPPAATSRKVSTRSKVKATPLSAQTDTDPLVSPTSPLPAAAATLVSPVSPLPPADGPLVSPTSPASDMGIASLVIGGSPAGDRGIATSGDPGVTQIELDSQEPDSQEPDKQGLAVGLGFGGGATVATYADDESWQRAVVRHNVPAQLTLGQPDVPSPASDQPPASHPLATEDELISPTRSGQRSAASDQPIPTRSDERSAAASPHIPAPGAAAANDPPSPIHHVQAAMIKIGVDERTARLLAAEHDPELIAGWLRYVQTATGISRPAALLVSRLRANEPVPVVKGSTIPALTDFIPPPALDVEAEAVRQQAVREQEVRLLLVRYGVDDDTLGLWLTVRDELAVREPFAYQRCFRDAFLARPQTNVALIVLPPRVDVAEAARYEAALRDLLEPRYHVRDLILRFATVQYA